jgi:hypothetical protein
MQTASKHCGFSRGSRGVGGRIASRFKGQAVKKLTKTQEHVLLSAACLPRAVLVPLNKRDQAACWALHKRGWMAFAPVQDAVIANGRYRDSFQISKLGLQHANQLRRNERCP